MCLLRNVYLNVGKQDNLVFSLKFVPGSSDVFATDFIFFLIVFSLVAKSNSKFNLILSMVSLW